MKISIITICYNAENSIRKTIESVLKQQYDNYEYIIVDGKSKDNTLKIVHEYEPLFNGKMIIISEKDHGIYDAMNKGIKNATGDIIGLINADDYLANDYIFNKVVNNIKDADGVYGNLLYLDQFNKPYRFFNGVKEFHPPHPTMYLKKSIFKKYGLYDDQLKISADFDFMLRISNKVRLNYINNIMVIMSAGGVSTNGLRGYFNNFKESYKVLKKNSIKFAFIKNIYRLVKTFNQRLYAIFNRNKLLRLSKEIGYKKIISINTVCNGSTGKIMHDINMIAEKNNIDTFAFYGRRKPYNDINCEKIGGFLSFWWHVIITTFFDLQGHGSFFKTKKLISRIKEENPDIIYLHNIHGYYINFKLLFKYLRKFEGKIIWTFHDCFPITGHCAFFSKLKCEKWKMMCHKCGNKKIYPTSLLIDNSKNNYLLKKELFSSLNNLTIVVPTLWLKKIIKQSFMQHYPISIVNNGVDRSVFKYSSKPRIRMLLAVATIWEERKGLTEINELANELNGKYQIVLVGKINSKINKNIKHFNYLSKEQLVDYYNEAFAFINPSCDETFSLVTVEALMCGCPVIIKKGTAMEELIDNNSIVLNNQKLIDGIHLLEKRKIDNSQIALNAVKYDLNQFDEKMIEIIK